MKTRSAVECRPRSSSGPPGVFAAFDNRVEPRGEIALTVETKQRPVTLVGSHLLVATGRRPNTDDLCLDKAGVGVDSHGNVYAGLTVDRSVDKFVRLH